MIEHHWTELRAALLAEGGHDRLVDFLQDEVMAALVGRAQSMEKQRRDLAYEGVLV